MRRIYKYQLQVDDIQDVEMSAGAIVLDVQVQGETPCVWVEFDDSESLRVRRRFRTYSTGEPMEDCKKFKHYVGTYQLRDGRLAFHVYTDRVEYTG